VHEIGILLDHREIGRQENGFRRGLPDGQAAIVVPGVRAELFWSAAVVRADDFEHRLQATVGIDDPLGAVGTGFGGLGVPRRITQARCRIPGVRIRKTPDPSGAARTSGPLDVVSRDAVLGVVFEVARRKRCHEGPCGGRDIQARGGDPANGLAVEHVLEERVATRAIGVAVGFGVKDPACGVSRRDRGELTEPAEGRGAVVVAEAHTTDERAVSLLDVDAADLAGVRESTGEIDILMDLHRR